MAEFQVNSEGSETRASVFYDVAFQLELVPPAGVLSHNGYCALVSVAWANGEIFWVRR